MQPAPNQELAPLAKPVKLEYVRRFEAPAVAVWSLLAEFDEAKLTRGYVHHVEVTGSGVGMRRTLFLEPSLGQGSVTEELTALDPVRMTLAFRMVDSGPLPWALYQGYAEITPAGRDACVLYATSSFVAPQEQTESLIRASRRNYALFFQNIEASLTESRSQPMHDIGRDR